MKAIFTLLILIYAQTSFSQSDDVAGNYANTIETVEKNIFEYKLTLSRDGTFLFHYHSNIKKGIPPEVNKYGKGKWTVKNNVVSFSSDKQNDFDQKYTLDFTDSSARFVTKSPRDKSDQLLKTRLKFLRSEIPWMRGIEIFKK